MRSSVRITPWIVTLAALALLAAMFSPGVAPARAYGVMTLDGVRDAGYGAAVAADPAGDLAYPGPGGWSGTTWTDLTALYCQNDDTYLYVYADLPNYSQTASSGQIGLLVDRGTTAGGAADPWGNAITFGQANKPDYALRGNIPGINNPPNYNNGWTELRTWSGSVWNAWNVGGTNWGGLAAGSQTSSKVAYRNNNGVEFKIPLSDLGSPALGSSLNLAFFATQEQGSGQTKGAYDTVPTDDQSTGWDDATTLVNWAACSLTTSGAGGTSTPTATSTATRTPTPTATPAGTTCDGASVGDGAIVTGQIYHLNTDAAYYDPQGAVPADGSVKLRLRTCANDVQTVQVLVWLTGADLVSPSFTYNATAVSSSGYTTWEATVPGPGSVINQWYQFRVSDGGSMGQFNPVSGNTGAGKWYTGALQNPSWALPTGPATGGGGGATTCAGATAGDNSIAAVGLYHNNLEVAYRNPVGAIDKDGAATVILRTCKDDVSSVDVLVWTTGAGATPSNVYAASKGVPDETYDYWSYAVPGPGTVIDQWYQFRVKDGTAVGHFHSAVNNTGPGAWALSASPVNPSWSLPSQGAGGGGGGGGVPAEFAVPTWLADAVIYQIFPDRFRNGSTANDPVDGTKVYEPDGCAGYPHAKPNPAAGGCQQHLRGWTDPLLIPSWGLDFHGGDLQGVIEKINAGYFNALGVNTLYFNPIFEASSNHGYETNDYFNVRAFFGGNARFTELMDAANAKGLRVILDGVFNHAGMDSKYLDPYNRYPSVTGACESAASPYRAWFTPGDKGAGVCSDGWGWKGWYGYATLPEFVDASAGVRDLFFRGGAAGSPDGKSVSQYWQEQGIAGWRYDVAQDITHDFFAGMRPYVKGTNAAGTVYGDSEKVMLGEVTGGCDWYLYQSYINGNELDSVMNYCFRDWASGYGNGDSPSQFDGKYNQFRALFPRSAWMGFMNLISTHDSPRMLNYLGNNKARLKLVTLLQFTLPGAPSVYYGDEVGMGGGGDPDNRRTFPWPDINGGANGQGDTYDADMLAHFKKILGLRRDHSVLRRGDVKTLLVSDASKIYSYIRWDASEKIVVVLNNDINGASHSATIPVAAHLPDGTVLTDLLNPGYSVTVSGGNLVVDPVSALWGRVLGVVAPPAVNIAKHETDGTAVMLTWQADSQTYNVYEHDSQPYFAPVDGSLLGAGSGQFNASGALAGPPWINRYYVIQKSGGLPSNRTGVFHFALVAGN